MSRSQVHAKVLQHYFSRLLYLKSDPLGKGFAVQKRAAPVSELRPTDTSRAPSVGIVWFNRMVGAASHRILTWRTVQWGSGFGDTGRVAKPLHNPPSVPSLVAKPPLAMGNLGPFIP